MSSPTVSLIHRDFPENNGSRCFRSSPTCSSHSGHKLGSAWGRRVGYPVAAFWSASGCSPANGSAGHSQRWDPGLISLCSDLLQHLPASAYILPPRTFFVSPLNHLISGCTKAAFLCPGTLWARSAGAWVCVSGCATRLHLWQEGSELASKQMWMTIWKAAAAASGKAALCLLLVTSFEIWQ